MRSTGRALLLRIQLLLLHTLDQLRALGRLELHSWPHAAADNQWARA